MEIVASRMRRFHPGHPAGTGFVVETGAALQLDIQFIGKVAIETTTDQATAIRHLIARPGFQGVDGVEHDQSLIQCMAQRLCATGGVHGGLIEKLGAQALPGFAVGDVDGVVAVGRGELDLALRARLKGIGERLPLGILEIPCGAILSLAIDTHLRMGNDLAVGALGEEGFDFHVLLTPCVSTFVDDAREEGQGA
ncbi:hypothetical protein [Salinicola peritrichatus]|uniref:hypothetical protein n=1 Tax=Salinicola peritrichatus TaxID=1267424 RepID=UPI0013A6058D|nr:hypothetical protein [Salinicola peritrichatus]